MTKRNLSILYRYVTHGLVAAILVVSGMLIMKNTMSPKIVKIDLVAITTHYTQLMMKNVTSGSTADNAAVQRISNVIKDNLEPAITDYAKSHNVAVIQAQAIVDTNTPDITNEIINTLDGKLK